MKKNIYNVIFTVLIFTVIAGILLISSTNTSYVPYTKNQYYPYEGFSDYNPKLNLEYSNIDDSEIIIQNKYSIQKKNIDCDRPYGFNGLFCKPGVADNTIDMFSSVSSNPSCIGNSSGLSNSKGSLCLDKNLITMLQTRGGNQTCGNMQIGCN